MQKYADNVSMSTIVEGDNPTHQVGVIKRFLREARFMVQAWHERRRSRRALDRLTAADLKDIGISRHDARNEYRKSLFID